MTMGDCAICYVTGNVILADEFADNGGMNTARFTKEFNSWVSEIGQLRIEGEVMLGENINPEWQRIVNEWNREDSIER
jgi:signal-transduction protein with cAMP-binding, CBS, and nucleotidyltransferase domain